MSHTTKNINKVTGTVISASGRLIIYAIMLIIAIKGASMAYTFGHDIFYASSVDTTPGTDIEITIDEGTGTSQAAKLLKKEGLINNELSFEVQSKFFELSITPGTYTLNTSETSRQILEDLDEGPVNKKEEE